MQHSLVFALRGYQRVVSPALMGIFGPLARCRFEPSCSEYAIEAVRKLGAFKGAILATWRVCRCNPWGGCGHDPVPGKSQISNFQFQIGNDVRQPDRSCETSHAHNEPKIRDAGNRAIAQQFEISNFKLEMREAPDRG